MKLKISYLIIFSLWSVISFAQSFVVYPNPISESFVLQGPTKDIDTANIFNVNGVLVTEITPELFSEVIFLEGLAKGIYFLKLTSNNGSQSTIKLLKQ